MKRFVRFVAAWRNLALLDEYAKQGRNFRRRTGFHCGGIVFLLKTRYQQRFEYTIRIDDQN
jgi:hypothetical protein